MPVAEWLEGNDGWSKRIHPDDREAATTGYQQAVAAGEPYHASTG